MIPPTIRIRFVGEKIKIEGEISDETVVRVIGDELIRDLKKRFQRILVELYGKDTTEGLTFITNVLKAFTSGSIPETIKDLYIIADEEARPDVFVHIGEKKITFASKIFETDSSTLASFLKAISSIRRPPKGTVYKLYINKGLERIVEFLNKNIEKLHNLHELLLHENLLETANSVLENFSKARILRFCLREKPITIIFKQSPMSQLEIHGKDKENIPSSFIKKLVKRIKDFENIILSYTQGDIISYVGKFLENSSKYPALRGAALSIMENANALTITITSRYSAVQFDIKKSRLKSDLSDPENLLKIASLAAETGVYGEIFIGDTIEMRLHGAKEKKYIIFDANWLNIVEEEIMKLKAMDARKHGSEKDM
ncbi:MAG: hypothetical protein ACTSVA_03555 [Candidatus Njordarchaeales archaeon]